MKTILEKLRDSLNQEKTAEETEKVMYIAEDLLKLVNMAKESKERGEDGFYIPVELMYLADAFKELLKETARERQGDAAEKAKEDTNEEKV